MKFAWVTPTNVVLVAQTLRQLDRIHLQEPYHEDASYFADQLHRALKHYQMPPQSEAEQKTWRNIESIEAALIHLLTEVKLFLKLLTPETQQQLMEQFQSKN